jgi:hypothetical protein
VTTTATDIGRAMFEPADRLDVDGWCSHLSEQVHFRFGNVEPLDGRDAVHEAVSQFFAGLKGLRHQVLEDWTVGDRVIQQLLVTYTRPDDSQVTVPAVNILRIDDELIGEYLIYVDLAPLYA